MRTTKSLLAVLLCLGLANASFADKVCIKSTIKNKKVRVIKRSVPSSSLCAKGYTELFDSNLLQSNQIGPQGVAGPIGPQGPQGPAGSPGELRIYGDGSAGPLLVSSARDLVLEPPAGNNFQFSSCTINPGATLTVSSGTVLRCASTFSNQGTILVRLGASGGSFRAIGNGTDNLSAVDMGYRDPSQGSIAISQAQHGSRGDGTKTRGGGFGGTGGYSEFVPNINPFTKIWYGIYGGSGGAGSRPSVGGAGGGALYVYAFGAVLNSGDIRANGNSGGTGCGGGGGGVIVLASKTSVSNTGTISAKGGDGGEGADNAVFAGGATGFGLAPGGSGGGGLVVLASPGVSPGSIDVSPGDVSPGISITSASVLRIGGGGGGASAGSGGSGASASTAGLTAAGSTGSSGSVVVIEADPTALY